MSDQNTIRMIEAYNQQATRPDFLSTFAQSPPRNFHDQAKIEIDIVREDEDIAVVIQDFTSGARYNEASVYTNKELTPPVYDEQGVISANDLQKRLPGMNPFEDTDQNTQAILRAFDIAGKLERKIRRAVELQWAQIFTTGQLNLTDQNGDVLYTLDYNPKATHFVTTGSTWAAGAGDPLGDIESMADVIRDDGKEEANKLIFGKTALSSIFQNAQFLAQLDNRRFNRSDFGEPEMRRRGGKFHGRLSVADQTFEVWSYKGKFKDPQTGLLTPYIPDDYVIVMGDGRMDMTWGSIPMVRAPQQEAVPFLPSRISDGDRGMDLTMNAWFEPNGRQVNLTVGSRPLAIPTAIDTFGRIDVIP